MRNIGKALAKVLAKVYHYIKIIMAKLLKLMEKLKQIKKSGEGNG